ncbi:hypothetical protein BS78_04G301300 [Paspalum vaginatum]|nr:hypothetical protein BS78_04G301300 [Paspalum vaginatum]
MESRQRRLASFVALRLLAALVVGHLAAAAAETARVGVILDLASVAGTRWQTSIRMAVEDYYAEHANSTTSVELHFRDSSGDAVAAVSAAVDLIKNAQVQAIIDGSTTAAEAEFVAHIGGRAHVPVISFSILTKAPETPFFVAAAPDDSMQAAPVAGVLANFGWRAAVLLHEDSRFGAGIVPALADALRGVGADVAHRAAVPADASNDRLDAVLYRASAITTRVLVVHMRLPLAMRLFRRAKSAGMMSEGYVWIATAGAGMEEVDTPLGLEDADAVRGIVSVRQYVPRTSKADDFARRFRARFQMESDGDPTTTSTFRAYDAAWAVTAAVEAAGISGSAFGPQQAGTGLTELDQLGVSATGEKLLKALRDTAFDGLTGKFRLLDGQPRTTPAYEIVNCVGDGQKTVGFWTRESGISPELAADSGEGLKPILFPGVAEQSDGQIPKGWAFSPVGQELVIAVPVKHGFQQFVHVYNDTTTNRTMISGYCIDVFDAAIKALPYPVYYRYEPSYGIGVVNSYDQLIDLIPEQKADAIVGDVAITESRMAEVDFTMPFTESGWSMVVAVQAQTATGMFFFLKPLTPNLWLASLAAFIFTGFVIWVIEHRINPEFRGTPLQQLGIIFHYSFSTLVFAHRENVESNLSKFLMVIWVFAVLILTSSYTASLTSMLTVQKLKPAVTDVNDLISNGDYVGYQEGSFVAGELLQMKFDQSKLRSYSTPAEYADALSRGSDNGGVAAVFDEVPYLKIFLSQYCDSYTMSGPVYKGTGLGFVFPKGSPMTPEVSRAIVGLTEGDDMGLIERKWFGAPGSCGDGVDASNASLTLWNFSGLFLITAVASSLVLVIYLVMFVYRERHELRAAEPGSGSVSLKRFRAWLQHYDRKDMSAPHFKQQSWSDDYSSSSSRNGSSHGKNRGSTGQEGATAMQDFSGPLSDHSCMDSASPQERMGEAGASTEKRSSTPERKTSLKLSQNTEERKKLPLSP